MAIYAIADLHLSLSADKPMEVFGDQWTHYMQKIEKAWKATVKEDDAVLIAGDISWAMHFEDAKADLNWIDQLPGKKYLIKGNHDYWWTSLKKMNQLWPSIRFIHNSYEKFGDFAICGSRGWTVPNPKEFSSEDERIYNREVIRLRNSFEQAKKAGYDSILCMIHYPPLNESLENNGFSELFEEFGVKQVVYGHLHTEDGFKIGPKGLHDGVAYYLTSCDFLEFAPMLLLE